MAKAKNNQSASHFSYKNDDVELVELSQFIRDTMPHRVEREWYIFFDKMTGEYLGYKDIVPNYCIHKIRNPDIILINKETKKLLLVIEIDGGIHDKKFFETETRNQDYFLAGVPLLVISKLEIETTIFDLVSRKVGEYFENN